MIGLVAEEGFPFGDTFLGEPGIESTFGTAINAAGEVACNASGFYTTWWGGDTVFYEYGFVSGGAFGTFTPLSNPLWARTVAHDINDRGQVVGIENFDAAVLKDGVPTNLSLETGVYLATARGVVPGRLLKLPAARLHELAHEWFPFAAHLVAGLYGTARSIEATARQRGALVTLGTTLGIRTFGGPESDSGYGDGPTEKLGPADLVHEPDGSVTIEGKKVDNPEDYKGERLPDAPEPKDD